MTQLHHHSGKKNITGNPLISVLFSPRSAVFLKLKSIITLQQDQTIRRKLQSPGKQNGNPAILLAVLKRYVKNRVFLSSLGVERIKGSAPTM